MLAPGTVHADAMVSVSIDTVIDLSTVDVATSSSAFAALAVLGTLAFAVSGAAAAARANMDWLGAVVLAVVVAIGGGTIRDLLLGEFPVFWLESLWPVFAAIGTAVVVIIALRWRPHVQPEKNTLVLVADAAGLSAFTVLGTDMGMEAGLEPFAAVILGVITGVGGGVLRDLLTGNRPAVLVGQIYAVAAIAGGALFSVLVSFDVAEDLVVWLSVASIFVIRLVAIRYDWHLPRVSRSSHERSTLAPE